MRLILTSCLFFLLAQGIAQTSGTITVGGDFNNFYPVTWYDANWDANKATEVSISRPDVHDNSTWRGSLESKFSYHTTQWGHGSNFIEPYIVYNVTPFIAGYQDGT